MGSRPIKKLPPPTQFTPEAIRSAFEAHGYQIVPAKKVSIDVLDLIVPLLTMLQWVQFWGQSCRVNAITTGVKFDIGFRGISVHAAQPGQTVGVVPCSSIDDVLNMPSTWFANLRRYGTDPELRQDRLEDEDYVQIENEALDLIGNTLLHLLSLLLPPSVTDEGSDTSDS